MANNEERKTVSEQEISEMSFEQAIGNLTGIVDDIECGGIELEKSLQQYETGMAMIKRCRSILQDAEKRIKKLSQPDEK